MAAPAFQHLVEIGPNLWNIRSNFKMFYGIIDIGTHMTLIRLRSGKFLAVDTVQITPAIKAELDTLTESGKQLEAVVATHPYHTVFFAPFHDLYPSAKYYGTPRHLRVLPQIPWSGDVSTEAVRKLWNPEVEMRIPAGAEFNNPLPPNTNHFSNMFVFHKESRTVHNDDTVVYSVKPGFLMSIAGFKDGTMAFHPSIKGPGLLPTASAADDFKNWVLGILQDWDFDNLLTAHNGNKIGGAKALLRETLEKAEKILRKHAEKYRGVAPPPPPCDSTEPHDHVACG